MDFNIPNVPNTSAHFANIGTIADNVQEARSLFFEKVAAAPLLSLPGLDVRTGVSKERIDLITPTISLTSGRKTSVSSKTSAELFSQNDIDPDVYEELFDLPIHAIRQTSVGQYGSDDQGAFLENPNWMSNFTSTYLAKLDLAVESLIFSKLKGYVEGGNTGNAAGAAQFTGTRSSANATLVSPTTETIAFTNIDKVYQFIQAGSRAVRTGGGNKFIIMSDGDLNTMLRSFFRANGYHIQPETIDNALVYRMPNTNVGLVSVNGAADGEWLYFDTPNCVIKMAADFKMGYFDRDDQLWVRPRVWVDANFGFYEEVTTGIASL